MKYEHHSTPSLRADTGHGHRPTLWNHRGPTCTHHDETVRCLQTLRAAQDVPRFRARVTMTGAILRRLNARRNLGLHVSCCVGQVCLHDERPDDCDPLTTGRTPALLRDGKEPVLAPTRLRFFLQ